MLVVGEKDAVGARDTLGRGETLGLGDVVALVKSSAALQEGSSLAPGLQDTLHSPLFPGRKQSCPGISTARRKLPSDDFKPEQT